MISSTISKPRRNIAIVGGGIVGLATAWKISEKFPQIRIDLFEKEAKVGSHQTGNNSGVLHCGLYYKPGSLKARMAVQGIREMVEFCQTHEIPHEVCGKLVVATDEEQVARLDELERRGRANGLSGIRRLKGKEIREREPHAAGLEALEVPEEGIVDYPAVAQKLAELLQAKGHSTHLDTRIRSGGLRGDKVRLHSDRGSFEADYAVNCGGLHSDRVCRDFGEAPSERIVPFRGEYYQLAPHARDLVKHLIYPVPDPSFPFLGVHFTRLIHGGIEAGPNAVLALSREGYRKTDLDCDDLFESLFFPGLWRFLMQYPSMCLEEIRQSLSSSLFCRNLQRLVPDIRESDLEPGGAGVRAQLMSPRGKLVEDFSLRSDKRILHVLNAPSPAATASLAIGSEIAYQVDLQ